MIDEKTRRTILDRGKPEPRDTPWWGEPNFGAWYTEEEIEAAVSAMRDSMPWSVGFGPDSQTVADFENAFAAYCGARHAVAVTNCGAGLDMAVICLDLQPGDEVICPAINYKTSQMVVLGRGGKVVFCDIDARTLNADPADVEKRITPRTRAIIPVHQTGLAAPVDDLLEVAARHPHPVYGPPKVIGDAARAAGASLNGHKVGASAWMTAFSFHSQKLMTTLGEGGMVVTNDDAALARMRDLCHYGGEHDWGMNFRMNKVQAAVGLVQLRRLDGMNASRRRVAHRRHELLANVPEITLPYEPPGYDHLFYVYPILVQPDWAGEKRDRILAIMEKHYGVVCAVTNRPTYRRWSYITEHCGVPDLPVSEDVGRRLLCPPLHPQFSEEQELYICAALLETIAAVRKEA